MTHISICVKWFLSRNHLVLIMMYSFWCIHFDIGCCRPIPSDVNLQKERPVSLILEGHGDHYVKLLFSNFFFFVLSYILCAVEVGCMSFPLEGHGDHFVKLGMQWCKRLGENETYYIHFVLFLIWVVVDPSPCCCRPQTFVKIFFFFYLIFYVV